MLAAPDHGQRVYLRGGHAGEPQSFALRWFVPTGFDAGGCSEIQVVANGKEDLTSCLALLGVCALAVMVGDVMDGTPVFETRACTAVDAAEHIFKESQRARGIAYSQTVWVDATTEDVYRRMRLWESTSEGRAR